MADYIDLTNQRFGKLLVIKRVMDAIQVETNLKLLGNVNVTAVNLSS